MKNRLAARRQARRTLAAWMDLLDRKMVERTLVLATQSRSVPLAGADDQAARQ
jgi:hypothetical protein